jgi:hypothetical protein
MTNEEWGPLTGLIGEWQGADDYNTGENQYLFKHASTLSYEATITIGDGASLAGELAALGQTIRELTKA